MNSGEPHMVYEMPTASTRPFPMSSTHGSGCETEVCKLEVAVGTDEAILQGTHNESADECLSKPHDCSLQLRTSGFTSRWMNPFSWTTCRASARHSAKNLSGRARGGGV